MLVNYPGPRTRRPPGAALELDPRRWVYMPKIDGCAARVRLDGHGRIASVLSRAGREIAAGRELYGIVAGFPDSILWGEMECWTEAGIRAATARGWAALHLWDCERIDGRDVSRLPFGERHGHLYRSHSWVEGEGLAHDAPHVVDARGVAHAPAGSAAAGKRWRFQRERPTGGQFVRHPKPRDLRRLPVVPLSRGPGAGEELWSSFVHRGGGEGVVACRLDAPIGVRTAKIKIRDGREIDAVVVSRDRTAATLLYAGRTFTVGARAGIRAGQVVAVAIDGWHERSVTPKHARIVRARPDLTPGVAP